MINLCLITISHASFSAMANEWITHVWNGNFNVEWDKICDNRDLTLLSSNHHQIHSHILGTLKDKTCLDEILWLRYRFVLLQALAFANHLSEDLFGESNKQDAMDNGDAKNVENDREKLSIDTFAKLIEQFEELCNVVKITTTEKTTLNVCLILLALLIANSFYFYFSIALKDQLHHV